jgi:3-hydroxyisobutyrate dehydrogenase-like beta-hydroxyacid dehydrogenase
MQTVGFIGLGAMGHPMAENVSTSEYELVVYNRSPERTEPFADNGVPVADSPREVGERADVVITMVTNDEALAAVLDGPDGLLAGLNGHSTVVQMSTVSPDATAAAAETIRAQNAAFVDAPVSGTVGPAETGTLTVLAGGDDDTIDEIEGILDVVGKPVVRCGGVGDGTRMKLFVNALLGDMMGAYAEALVFGAASGLEYEAMQQVVEAGAVDSPLFRSKGPNIAEGDFEPRFPVDLQFKDLRYATDTGNEIGVTMPQTAATREAFSAASALGHGDADMAAVIKYFESIAGVKVSE